MYANYQLLALDENGISKVDSFRIPSACTCHHNNFIGERLYTNKTDNTQPELTSPVCDTNALSRGAPRIATRPNKQIKLCKKTRAKRSGKSDDAVVFNSDMKAIKFTQQTSRPNINHQGSSRPNFYDESGGSFNFNDGNRGRNNQGCQLLQPKECANNKVICDDNSDYPEDIVRQRIQRVSAKIRDLYLKVI